GQLVSATGTEPERASARGCEQHHQRGATTRGRGARVLHRLSRQPRPLPVRRSTGVVLDETEQAAAISQGRRLLPDFISLLPYNAKGPLYAHSCTSCTPVMRSRRSADGLRQPAAD